MAEIKAIQLSGFKEFDAGRPVSKLLHDSERCRVVLFCLEEGQEISPHESTSEVVFYGVEGKSHVSIGADKALLEPETLITCPPQILHGIKAESRTTVLAVITPRPQ